MDPNKIENCTESSTFEIEKKLFYLFLLHAIIGDIPKIKSFRTFFLVCSVERDRTQKKAFALPMY